MNPIPYTYQVIRYVHDPAAGEALNVWVVLYAPDAPPHLFVRFDHRYERLSAAFASFDGDHFRQTLRAFESTADRLRADWDDPDALPGLLRRPEDAQALVAHVWPDRDLSFQTGPLMAGITDDPVAALEGLFHRLVISQKPEPRRERRSDEEVWQSYQPHLAERAITRVLQPRLFQTDDFQIEFPHAYKNEKWHPLQPLSLDYQRPENMQATATRWLGNAVALESDPEIGKLYLLLGEPRLESNRRAYVRAKNLLHKMPLAHELVEEHEADSFADMLADEMRAHGLLKDDDHE